MTGTPSVVMVDWSGGNQRPARPSKDAIWIGSARGTTEDPPLYRRNRAMAEETLAEMIDAALTIGQRLLIGFDFPFAYPSGFAKALTGAEDPFVLWDWLDTRIIDSPHANNRFEIAGQINLSLGQGRGPFWGNALPRDIPGLPRTKSAYANPFPDHRVCEAQAKGTFTCWQLAGAGAVGSQVLMGLPVLARLRRRFAGRIAVAPFDSNSAPITSAPITFVEIWPGLISPAVRSATGPDDIRDAVQMRLLARAVSRLPYPQLQAMLAEGHRSEGWILGLGHEQELLTRCP